MHRFELQIRDPKSLVLPITPHENIARLEAIEASLQDLEFCYPPWDRRILFLAAYVLVCE